MPTLVTSAAFHAFESAGPSTVWVVVVTFVFIECALIVGMFLPGDSMLLAAGMILAQQVGAVQAMALAATAVGFAVAGNHVGYLLGRRTGIRFWAREGGRVLNRHNLQRAHRFFERWGFWAIVVARWLPWVRTVAPTVAGAARMDRGVFLLASIVGALAWIPTLIMIGYHGAGLIEALPWLKPLVLILAVIGFTLTVLVGLWRYRQDIRKPVDESADLPAGELGQPVSGVSLAE